MIGIDLNKPVIYKCASLRFFQEKEHHVTRFCRDNVLLMVYEGVLRFSEDGKETEVRAGEYYIQRKNCQQAGVLASDAPQYLYVHFDAEWSDLPDALASSGKFDIEMLFELMKRIDKAAHGNDTYSELQYLFLAILLSLRKKVKKNPVAKALSEYVDENFKTITSLFDICEKFYYSKNYIIQIFNKEFGISPFQYINEKKVRSAMYLLETTSKSIVEIAEDCGYADYTHFYKQFVKKTGISPSIYRKRIQKYPTEYH